MPYRVEIDSAGVHAFDRLVELGALDAEASDGGVIALMPDGVDPARIRDAFGVDTVSVSPAVARDAGSVWILRPRRIRIGRLSILPAESHAEVDAIKLIDAAAFGTGLHPTTALCLEALQDLYDTTAPARVLDVGTGSGVLALAALTLGIPHALGIDTDDDALRVAAENARLNGLDDRLELRAGGPETITGTWPLVLANILAAPLIEMAPALVQRVGHYGRLVLSGIPSSVEHDVDRAYRHLGMSRVGAKSLDGWVALILHATW